MACVKLSLVWRTVVVLNMLVNVLGKKPSDLFDEFAGKHDETWGTGDVKYHQGFSADFSTPGGDVHLALAFNPSHLEIVNPVVIGSVRARQDRLGDTQVIQYFRLLFMVIRRLRVRVLLLRLSTCLSLEVIGLVVLYVL